MCGKEADRTLNLSGSFDACFIVPEPLLWLVFAIPDLGLLIMVSGMTEWPTFLHEMTTSEASGRRVAAGRPKAHAHEEAPTSKPRASTENYGPPISFTI